MILFSGDSFSAYDDSESWTYHFAKNMNLNFKNYSIEGSSFWSAFEKLDVEDYRILENYYDYLVITCTNYRRIPFCQNPHDSAFYGKVESEPLDSEKKKHNMAHINYYDRFYSEKMHKFLYERLLEFIITKFCNHTKIIFLPVFEDSLISIKKTYNIWPDNIIFLNFPLIDISSIDKKSKNHFTKETNKVFGKLLAERVKQINSGPVNLTTQEIKDAIK